MSDKSYWVIVLAQSVTGEYDGKDAYNQVGNDTYCQVGREATTAALIL
jgi:hypothetical protein